MKNAANTAVREVYGMGLFANEILKIRHSKSIKIISLVFIFCAVVFTSVGELKGTALMRSGLAGPFMWIGNMGASGFFAYGAVVAGMVASEFELGVVRNAIGCGVKRSSYFWVKIVSVFGASSAVYLVSNCIFTLVMCARFGFDPEGLVFSDYGQKVLVYNALALLAMLAYVSVYICFAYLFQSAAATFVASVAVTIGELFWFARDSKTGQAAVLSAWGPIAVVFRMLEHMKNDTILTEEFAVLAIPCVCIITGALGLGYALFMRRSM